MPMLRLLFATIISCSLLHAGKVAADKTVTQGAGLEVTTHLGDNQVFAQNDVLSFLISLDKAAYITAIYSDASGQLHQVLPNAVQKDNYYQANLFIPLPANDAGFQFRVDAPYGRETLYVFASDGPATLPGKLLKNGLLKPDWPLARIRAFLQQHSDHVFEEASVSIQTQAHPAPQ